MAEDGGGAREGPSLCIAAGKNGEAEIAGDGVTVRGRMDEGTSGWGDAARCGEWDVRG